MAGISSIFVCILRSPLLLILLFLFFFLSRPRFINATYIINASTPIIDGKSLISAQGAFELGFFSPGTSPYRYLGIWFHYTPDKTVVWVANAKDPIRGSSGVLKISKRGLVLLDGDGNEVWNVAIESNNLSAELQDTGNFVLFEIVTSGSRRVLWQSFHHPSNTILPGMILERGQKLRAWKNISDPAGGEFSLELDSKADLDELIMKEGSKTYWKSGYWDPEIGMFSNLTEINPNNFFYFKLNTSSIDIHSVTYFSIYSNTRVVIDMTGQLKFFIWYEEGGRWVLVWTAPKDYCDTPVACGPNGVCSDLPCKCLMEFEPASPIDWKQGDYRGGCKRKTPLTCTKDMFMPLSIIQKPKNSVRWNLTGEGCKSECLDSCKCTAYSFGFATSTCDIWLQDLMGLGWDFMGESEVVENFHVRLAPSHAGTYTYKLHIKFFSMYIRKLL